jgi:hypothetical protein
MIIVGMTVAIIISMPVSISNVNTVATMIISSMVVAMMAMTIANVRGNGSEAASGREHGGAARTKLVFVVAFPSQRGSLVRFPPFSTVAILAQDTNLGRCGHASLLQNGGKASASMYLVIVYCKGSGAFDTVWPSAKTHQERR